MANGTNRVLFWAPRVLCMLLIAFVSMFALDVFGEGLGFWRTLVALAMHLVPTYILVAALVVSWKWEWVGTALFGLCGFAFLEIVRGPIWVKGIFAVPCFLTAWLFFENWRRRRRTVSEA